MQTTRTNQSKSMAELVKAPYVNTLTGNNASLTHNETSSSLMTASPALIGVSNKIAFAKELPKKELTLQDLRKQIGLVCVTCGIRDLPSATVDMICLKLWQEKFSARMNQKELELAFELNISGDLDEKVNHYQCFSPEYFCDVLNKYLIKKAEITLKLPKHEPDNNYGPTAEMYNQTLLDIIADFKAYHLPEIYQPVKSFPLISRLEMLCQMFEVDLDENTIAELREKARLTVIRDLCARKTRLLGNESKFGARVSLEHQIARLRAGKLINHDDERLLQYEVNSLLYRQTLQSYKPKDDETVEDCAFVRHVTGNMAK